MKQFRDTPYYISEEGRFFRNGKELSPHLSNKGYKVVSVWINNRVTKYNLHRIVAEIYVLNPDNKCCVNHKDGNKLNNHIDNLEWVTLKENSYHSVNVLLREVGEKHSQAKVPNKIVSYLKRCKNNNVEPNYQRIANTYGVGIQHIKNIYKGYKRKLI